MLWRGVQRGLLPLGERKIQEDFCSFNSLFKRVWRRSDSSAKYFLTVFTFDQSCIAKPFKCAFVKEKKVLAVMAVCHSVIALSWTC